MGSKVSKIKSTPEQLVQAQRRIEQQKMLSSSVAQLKQSSFFPVSQINVCSSVFSTQCVKMELPNLSDSCAVSASPQQRLAQQKLRLSSLSDHSDLSDLSGGAKSLHSIPEEL